MKGLQGYDLRDGDHRNGEVDKCDVDGLKGCDQRDVNCFNILEHPMSDWDPSYSLIPFYLSKAIKNAT